MSKISVVFGNSKGGYKYPVKVFTEADGGHEAAAEFAKGLKAYDQLSTLAKLPEAERDSQIDILKRFMPGPDITDRGMVVDFDDNGLPVAVECFCHYCEGVRNGTIDPNEETQETKQASEEDEANVKTIRLSGEAARRVLAALGLDEDDAPLAGSRVGKA